MGGWTNSLQRRVGVMDFVEILPPEIVEKIFQHLSSKDVLSCSLVSLKWREVVNCTRVWSHICSIEGPTSKKEFLLHWESYFANPTKRFRPVKNVSERLSDLCFWRCHYDQYKHLEANWKRGKFAIHQLNAVQVSSRPSHYNDGILVVQDDYNFTVFSVRSNISEIARIPIKDSTLQVENVAVRREFLVYTQSIHIIGLYLYDSYYEEAFELSIPCDNRSIDNTNGIHIITSDNYLIYNSVISPCHIFVYDLKNNKSKREINIDKNRGDFVTCTCLDALDQKVFLALTNLNSQTLYSVLEFDFITGDLCAEYTIQHPVIKFYFAEGILGGQVSQNNAEDTLYLWSLADKRLLTRVSVNGKQPILLTKDVVFHCQNNTVIMQSVETLIDSKFIVRADTIVNMTTVGKSLLAINTGDAIEIWDWGTGEKLYTPYRGVCSTSMWVDDRVIIILKWAGHFQIIGFW